MPLSSGRQRSRLWLGLALAVTIAAGLSTRAASLGLPGFIVDHGGDALWTVAVYIVFALLLPRARPLVLMALALGASTMVELSQLYQADWLLTLRSTRPGALLLGHGFLLVDLVRYSAGALVAFTIDSACRASGSSAVE